LGIVGINRAPAPTRSKRSIRYAWEAELSIVITIPLVTIIDKNPAANILCALITFLLMIKYLQSVFYTMRVAAIRRDPEKRMVILDALRHHPLMASAFPINKLLRFSPSESVALSIPASHQSRAPRL
jgi:hypothetical protein